MNNTLLLRRHIRQYLREVMHPAIEQEKTTDTGAAAVRAPPAAAAPASTPTKKSQTTTAKPAPGSPAAVPGYRVQSGEKKGTVTGHKDDLNVVLWDDGTSTNEPGSKLTDLKEFIARCLIERDIL